jgi:hypothetical protein
VSNTSGSWPEVDGSAPAAAVRFGPADHETLSTELASRFMQTMREHAPGQWGYYMAWAMTGQPPTAPPVSRRRSAPDSAHADK